MTGTGRPAGLAQLRDRIARIEGRPVLAETAAPGLAGSDPVTGLAGGVLHEVWADHFSHGGAAAGFVLGAARRFVTPARPAVLWLTLRDEAREVGLGYAGGVMPFLDPERLLIGRMQTITDLLWAAEEAVACSAIAAVVAETGRQHRALDFTATRRLNLRAMASGAPVLLLRYGAGREATAAAWRWHVAPAPSRAHGFDARAPGAPRWQVTLEKGQGAQGIRDGAAWLLGWTENGFVADENGAETTSTGRAAVSGAVPAPLGDGLSQTA